MKTDADLKRWALENGATVTLDNGNVFNAGGRQIAAVRKPAPVAPPAPAAAPPPTPPAPRSDGRIEAAIAEIQRAIAALAAHEMKPDSPPPSWTFRVERGEDGLITQVIAEPDTGAAMH